MGAPDKLGILESGQRLEPTKPHRQSLVILQSVQGFKLILSEFNFLTSIAHEFPHVTWQQICSIDGISPDPLAGHWLIGVRGKLLSRGFALLRDKIV